MNRNDKYKEWLEKIKESCQDLTLDQKIAVTNHTRYVVWKAMDEKFEALINELKGK